MQYTPSQAAESPYKGSGSLTREQMLFYETRTTAKLIAEGLNDDQILERILSENLFQYPTEKTIRQTAKACLARLHALDDMDLVYSIARQDSFTAKQICLYAMMCQYRLVWDFMITVIGNKYRQQDFTYSRRDINIFLIQLQEQDDLVATWSEGTIKKIGSVISRILIENEYIDDGKATRLNPVLISPVLENAIRGAGQEIALSAFNCFS